MGTAQVKTKNKNIKSLIQPPKITIKVEVDVNRAIPLQLTQLSKWSLSEIKNMYQTFQRMAESPMLDGFLFKKIMPMSKKNSEIMFSILSQGQKYISIFELVCILVLTSYQTYRKKFQFLCLIFDFQCKGNVNGKQFLLIFYSMLFGYCRLTKLEFPKFKTVEQFGQASYFPGEDFYQNKPISLRKFIQQYDGNQNIINLFNRFQYTELKQIKQDPLIYTLSEFKKMAQDDITKYYRIIDKIYSKNDYQQVYLIEQNRELRRKQRRDSCFRKLIQQKNTVTYQPYQSPVRIRSQSFAKFNQMNSNSQRLNKQEYTLSPKSKEKFRVKKMSSTIKLKPVENRKLIFLNGHTHTKNEIFEAINYFKSFAQSQQKITIKEFFKKFDKHVFLKKQLSSIFKFMDYHKNGQLTLQGFFKSFYPGINQKDMKVLKKWYSEYQEIYEADSLVRNQVKIADMSDARILPIQTLQRMKQIFRAMDNGNKGFLNFQDIRKAYKQGFTVDELENLLKQYGEDKKIKLNGLCKMLLPLGWSIEGLDLNNLQ